MRGTPYYFKQAYANSGNAPAVKLPAYMNELTAAVRPLGVHTVRLEFTLNPPAEVEANPDACTWIQWSPGNVSSATAQALLGSITGVRAVSSAAAGVELILAGRY